MTAGTAYLRVAGDPEQKTVTFQMQQPVTLKFSDQPPAPPPAAKDSNALWKAFWKGMGLEPPETPPDPKKAAPPVECSTAGPAAAAYSPDGAVHADEAGTRRRRSIPQRPRRQRRPMRSGKAKEAQDAKAKAAANAKAATKAATARRPPSRDHEAGSRGNSAAGSGVKGNDCGHAAAEGCCPMRRD